MQLTLTGKNHLEITEALRTHTADKFNALEKYFNQLSNVNVVLHVEHHDYIAEATIHYLGSDIHASSSATDMYAAIDETVEKIHRQLQKHKEKMIDSHQ